MRRTPLTTTPRRRARSETVTSLSYFLRESDGSLVDPSTVPPPSDDALTRAVFNVVADGRYDRYTRRVVIRLGDAFQLFAVGRLDAGDADAVLRAVTADWKTLLGTIMLTWY